MIDVETIKLIGVGLGTLLANYIVTRASNIGKADAKELLSLQNTVNALSKQNEIQQRDIDRLNTVVIKCHDHRDQLIVERDKLSQQIVMMILERERLSSAVRTEKLKE